MIELPLKEIEGAIARSAEGLLNAFIRVFAARQGARALEIEARANADAELVRADTRRKIDLLDAEAKRNSDLLDAAHDQQLELLRKNVQAENAGYIFREKHIELEDRNRFDVMQKSVGYVANFAEDEGCRPLDDDWILRFLHYAASVDDEVLRSILAMALAEASSSARPIISPRAIDTIRFMDFEVRQSFDFVTRHLSLFGRFPESYLQTTFRDTPANFNFALLVEMGLVKITQKRAIAFFIDRFRLLVTIAANYNSSFSVIEFTRVGQEIASILHPGLRKRFTSDGKDGAAIEVAMVQRDLMVSPLELQRHAVSLVQEFTDNYGQSFHLLYHRDEGHPLAIADTTRRALDQPIGIKLPLWVDRHCEREAMKVLHEYLKWFDDFDKQLPNMSAHFEPFEADESYPEPD